MTSNEDNVADGSGVEEDEAGTPDLASELGVDRNPQRDQLLKLIALALVVSFPFMKMLYVTQSPALTGEIVRLYGPAGWVDVAIDNVLTYPLLFLVLFVLVSNSNLFAFLGDASRRWLGRPRSAREEPLRILAILIDLIAPVIGFLWALALFGLGWGIATALATVAYQMPEEVYELRNLVRDRRGRESLPRGRRIRMAESAMFQVTVLAVLPVAVLYTVLDGSAWQSVHTCTVQSVTEGDHAARVVEIQRGGSGIVTAWEIGTSNIVAGAGCVSSSLEVRDALWER